MTEDTLSVIFIGGSGRSGSTLLERMLAEVDSVSAIGELRHIWDAKFARSQLCGCGDAVASCRFWGAVLDEAFGRFDSEAFHEMRRLNRSLNRNRHIPKIIFPYRIANIASMIETYAEGLGRTYTAIRRVSGSPIIVDSTKTPSHGHLIGAVRGVRPYVVHLV